MDRGRVSDSLEPLGELLDRMIGDFDRVDAGRMTRALLCAALSHIRSIQSGRAGDVDACHARLDELVAEAVRRMQYATTTRQNWPLYTTPPLATEPRKDTHP